MKERVFILLLLSFIFCNSSIYAQNFSDDFNDGAADGWNEFSGNWAVINGEYVANGKDNYAFIGDVNWANYVYEARMKMDVIDNDFGLIFYAQSTNDYLRFTIGGEEGFNSPRISHLINQEPADELATVVSNPPLADDHWYDVRLILSGSNVSAFVDSELIAYTTGLPYNHGFIGLSSDSSITRFDNVMVTPEPVSSALFLLGGGAMMAIRLCHYRIFGSRGL